MAFSFIMTAIVIKKNFGGWTDLDPQTYLKPQFYQTPTGDQQWNFWQLTLLNFSFFALPHLIQRIYAAKDLRSLKVAFHVMNVGPWSSQLVIIFLGTVGVQFVLKRLNRRWRAFAGKAESEPVNCFRLINRE
jgi:Na+/proline symporter